MNRMSPLIARRTVSDYSPFEWDAPADEQASKILDDVRQFLTGWLGGLVFFGTFIA